MIYNSNKPSSEIGGKAYGLYELRRLGVVVPDFVVVPYANFKSIIEQHKARSLNSDAIVQKLNAYTLPQKDIESLRIILQKWDFGKTAVVVRSSIVDEDSATHAFPGIMKSFLNITTETKLNQAIAACAASAWSPTALAYRKQHNLNPIAQPAVIIQKQIEPDASGVVFSTFPEYPQELAIHAVYGFGEGLLNGAVTGDEFYFEKASGNLHRSQIAFKEISLSRKRNGELHKEIIDTDRQNQPCIDQSLLKKIFDTVQYLEKKYGRAVDVEFAIKDNMVFYVQMRPITQPIPEVVVYDNSNIQESYCGVTTPLTFSFATRAYMTVYKQTMIELGLSKNEIARHQPVLSNLLALVKGRIYYNINNWYRGLQLLPSFKQNKSDMETMMGLQEPVAFIKDVEKKFFQKIKLLPSLALNYCKLLLKIRNLHHAVPEFQECFNTIYTAFYNNYQESIDLNTLQKVKNNLDLNLLNAWSVPIINDFNVMMCNGSVLRKLRKAEITAPEEFLGRYLAGDQEIESTQPTYAMIALAASAREIPALKDLIVSMPPDLVAQVKQNHPLFYSEVAQFISQYGDRTVGELKLETVTMRVSPIIFYKYLRNFLLSDTPINPTTSQTSLNAKQELEKALKHKSYFLKWSLKNKLSKLKKGIQYRESLRLQRTKLFGMYRSAYLSHGKELASKKLLELPTDIFYLEENEILHLSNFKELVKQRKKRFMDYEAVNPPSRVVVPSPPLNTETLPIEKGILRGQGCFPGEVTGEVIVIKDPSDSLDVHNKIICALRTDPGWAALFPVCKAVIIEKGSSLSHSVIMLRELGIPTIVNVPDLCKRLETGMNINLDAASGTIFFDEQTAAI